MFLESPEADNLENTESLQLAGPRNSPLSPWLIESWSGLWGFWGRLQEPSLSNETNLCNYVVLIMDFPYPCKWLKITSPAVLFSPQKGSLTWQFGNLIVFLSCCKWPIRNIAKNVWSNLGNLKWYSVFTNLELYKSVSHPQRNFFKMLFPAQLLPPLISHYIWSFR